MQVRQMEFDDQAELLQSVLQLYGSLISNSKIESQSFENLQKKAKELIGQISNVLNPWLEAEKENELKKEAMSFREKWKQIAGFYPDDKEGAENWEKQLQENLDSSKRAAETASQQELEAKERFKKIAEEVRQKRLRQQGRRK